MAHRPCSRQLLPELGHKGFSPPFVGSALSLLSHSIHHFFSADWQPSSAPAALPPTHADLLPPMENPCSRPLFPQLPRDQLDCERNLEIFSLLFFHFVLCLKECHNFQQQRKGKRYARLTKVDAKPEMTYSIIKTESHPASSTRHHSSVRKLGTLGIFSLGYIQQLQP